MLTLWCHLLLHANLLAKISQKESKEKGVVSIVSYKDNEFLIFVLSKQHSCCDQEEASSLLIIDSSQNEVQVGIV